VCGQCRISLARSVQSLDTMQNSFGQGDPPKVSLKLGKQNDLNMMVHIDAMSP
jgi:hypothetical protein